MIEGNTARASLLLVTTRLITRAIDFLSLLILARTVAPDDFGLFALAMSVIYVTEPIFELPLSQALVRLSHVEKSHLDTSFTLSALRGLFVMSCLCLLAIPFSILYKDPRLILLIALLSISSAMRGLMSPSLALYAKQMSFWRDSVLEICGKLTALAAAATIALTTHSYFALAAGTITYPLITMALSYIIAPYKPHLSLTKRHVFMNFLGWNSAAQILSAFIWQSDRMMVGKFASRGDLGLFTTANDLALLPITSLLTPINRPLLSAFSIAQKNSDSLIKIFTITSTAIVTIGLPILAGESLLSKSIIRIILGEKWVGSADLLQWLSLSLVPSLFAVPFSPLVMALGQTSYFVRRNALEFCSKIPLVILGVAYFGFNGVLGARVISEVVTSLYCVVLARHLIGISVYAQLIAPWRSFVATFAMVAVILCISSVQTMLSSHDDVLFFFSFAIGSITYLATLLTLWYLFGQPEGLEKKIYMWLHKLLRQGLASFTFGE